MANYTNRGSHYKAASRKKSAGPGGKRAWRFWPAAGSGLAAGVAALAVPGLFRSEDSVTLEKTIYWWDNDNEGNPRPTVDKYEKPLLVLRDEANDVQYKSDDPDDPAARALLKSLNYPDGWPEVVVEQGEGNTWTVTTSPESLNKIVYEVDEETGEKQPPAKSHLEPEPGHPAGGRGLYRHLRRAGGRAGDLFGSFSTVGEDDWHYVRKRGLHLYHRPAQRQPGEPFRHYPEDSGTI